MYQTTWRRGVQNRTTENRKTIDEMSHSGFLTGTDIKNLLDKEIVIHPYSEENLTPVGYNFTFSDFIYSLFTNTFVEIINNENEPEYFWIRPNETVLVLTREMIWVSKHIGGTFHSKVSLVTEGLCHVSTTLDPGWQGQLLVPITNPTKGRIKVYIKKKENNKIQSFITLVLHRSKIAACIEHDNPPARIDLLMSIVERGNQGKKRKKFMEMLGSIQDCIYEPPDMHRNRKPRIDLNESTNMEGDIVQCKENYDKYNNAMQDEKNKAAISNFKKAQIRSRKIKSIFAFAIITLVLLIFAFIAIKFEGILGEVIKLALMPCFGIFSVVITDRFKRRFSWGKYAKNKG